MRGSPDSDDLVPLHEPFETAIRGFNRRQVLEHLESLDGRIAIALADRDAALAQVTQLSTALDHLRSQSEVLTHLRRETDKANSQIERILTTPMAEASARILHILKLAEEEAAELRNRAQAEIVASKARADQDIAELRGRAEEQIAELRACASREAKSLLEHARRQCDRLESESAARRKAVEQEAAQAIARREAATNERIRDRELRGLAGLHLMLRVVGEHLTNREGAVVRDESALHELRTRVTSEASTLETLRAGITAAVVATHKLFAEALEQVRKIPVEHPLSEQSAAGQPAVPAQRGTHDNRVYLPGTSPNNSNDDRRSPRAPH